MIVKDFYIALCRIHGARRTPAALLALGAVRGLAMATWRRDMPMGMVLCSPRRATQIPDPLGALTLQRYEMARGSPRPKSAAVRLDDFVAYGRWFQSQVIPDLDRRLVVRVQSREA